MNKFCLLILLLCCSASAKHLTPILSDTYHGVFTGQSQSADSYLLIVTIKNDQYMLWAFHPQETNKPFDLIATSSERIRLISANEDESFVVIESNNDRFLWQTDGHSKTKVSPVPVSLYFQKTTSELNSIFFTSANGDLYEWSGSELINHQISVPGAFRICKLNNEVVYLNFSGSDDGEMLWQLSDSGNQVIDGVLPNGNVKKFIKHNQSCYLEFKDAATVHIMAINLNQQLLELNTGITNFSNVFSHQGRLYGTGFGENQTTDKLYRLRADMTTFDKSVEIASPYFFGDSYSLGKRIVSSITSGGFETKTSYELFDKDLNRIGINRYFPTYYPQVSFADYRNTSYISFPVPDSYAQLQLVDPNLNIVSFKFPNKHLLNLNIIENSDTVYLHLLDEAENLDLYLLSDNQTINDQLSGYWVSPEIENQGLMIQLSQRTNGSQYVFLGLNTFINGKPFWLVGMAEFSFQSKMEIDLWEFYGIGFFESGIKPTQAAFGKLTLELNGCDGLDVVMKTADYQNSLSFNRIEDRSYDHFCNNILPWVESEESKP